MFFIKNRKVGSREVSAIAGIYHFNSREVSTEEINRVMRSFQSYPADDIQVWRQKGLFLGCHNQWITPESISQPIPFYNLEKKLVITADAIIDNREELFLKLGVDKNAWGDISDTELILLAYERWNSSCPSYLIGDFAFMIWDESENQLFGARDFSGARTLYYHHGYETFAFSTLVRPLLHLPFVRSKRNEEWIAEFLTIPWNFESVDTSSTVYEQIKQLSPGYQIIVKSGRVTLTRYAFIQQQDLLLKTNEEYEEAFKEVFQVAISSRIRTHKAIGAHLSGGLDSGSVVSFAAKALRNREEKLRTFSYVPIQDFVDWTPKYRIANEKKFIKSTVQYLGNIEDTYLDFKERNPFTEIDDWIDLLEMPYKFFENTFWLKGIYEEAARQNIGILLNGQRGNWTISWGHALDYQASLLKKLSLKKLSHEMKLYSQNIGVTRSRVFHFVRRKAFPLLHLSSYRKQESQFPQMVNPNFARKQDVYKKLKKHQIDLTGNAITSVYEVKEKQFEHPYYWNITGTYGSKLSVRYGVWDRDPTNDLRVIRFCLSVPESQYVQDGVDRSLIRRATKGMLPDNIRMNQKVKGVQGADGTLRMVQAWPSFLQEVEALISDEQMACYLDMASLKEAKKTIGTIPKPELIFDLRFRLLMRSLIFYRFMKKMN